MLITNTFINSYFKPVYGNKSAQTSFSAVNLPAFSGKKEDYEKGIASYQRKLSSLGIKSYLFDKGDIKNLILAKSVYDAFLEIRNAGFNIPKGISVHGDEAADHFEKDSNDMAYTGGDTKVYNSKMDVYHEFAHAHQAINNNNCYLDLRNQKFDSKTKNEITKCINPYAATDKAEFVAEYFAYKMAGIEIKSDKINLDKLYEKCQGPKFKKKLDLVA